MLNKLNNFGDSAIVCDFGEEVNQSINNEVLKLLASNDCGKTWSLRKIIQYSQLTTAPDQNNFIPTFSEWKEATVTSIIGPLCVQNFRFKFESLLWRIPVYIGF